jgi:DNA polymerase elongation subunit (family B)
MSYRNVCTYTKNGAQIVWEATWDSEGNRIEIETPVEPYLFYEDVNYKDSPYMSIYKKPLRHVKFKNSFERSEWIKTSKNIPLFEKFTPEKQYLLDKYCGVERTPEFVKNKLRTYFFDIEVEVQNCFPDPQFADFPINVLSIFDSLTGDMFVWTYNKNIFDIFTDEHIKNIKTEIKSEYEKDTKLNIFRFESEIDLLKHFLDWWELNYPDVVTGWNIDKFDTPYLINRIMKTLGDVEVKRLSPISWHKNAIKILREQKLKQFVVSYKIMGISLCDYLNLHKKFIPKSQQSYKLDYIAKMETGIGKLDYYEMGYDSIQDFMKGDFATFVKYNIIDTICVKKIDDVRHFIELMRRVCNMGLCEFECIFKSIPYIVGALSIVAREQGTKFLTDKNQSEDRKAESEGFEGAFVFPTKPGYYNAGVASFDFNSLYPNIMMSLNMSPETMIGKVITDIGEEIPDEVMIRKINGSIVKMSKAQFNEVLEKKCCIAANNVLFIKSIVKFGIVPTFLDGLYASRVSIKKEMKKNLKEAQKIGEEIEKLEKELKLLKKK